MNSRTVSSTLNLSVDVDDTLYRAGAATVRLESGECVWWMTTDVHLQLEHKMRALLESPAHDVCLSPRFPLTWKGSFFQWGNRVVFVGLSPTPSQIREACIS